MTLSANVPTELHDIVHDFAQTPQEQRLELLLEFSDEIPELPQRYADNPDLLEPVPECQSPVFFTAEVDGTGEDARVALFFSAPAEAPTTRGFAGILAEGLDGATARQVQAVPEDFALQLSLTSLVSPLRLNGMTGMLARIQRQVKEKAQL